jgi:hypothetical protein
MEALYKDPSNSLEFVAKTLGCSVMAVEKRATRHSWTSRELTLKRRRLSGKDMRGIDLGSAGRSVYAEQRFLVHLEYEKAGGRECSRCGFFRPLIEFRPLPEKQQTYKERGLIKRISHCNSCEKIRTADFKSIKSSTIEGSASFLMSNVKSRCKTKKLESEINKAWIVQKYLDQKGLCYYSGKKLQFSTNRKTSRAGGGYKKNNPWVVSVDRKNPNEGYTKRNTVLCCWVYNNLKQDLTEEQFYTAISEVLEHKKRASSSNGGAGDS